MTDKERIQIFKDELKPLYANLMNSIKDFEYSKASFCLQWGKNFPSEEHCGIMFVGRATNGWISDSEDVDILFGNSEEAIFNRHDQMQWVENLWGNENGYNTNNSAFWRVIKAVASHFNPEPWYSHIAWSNVCKVAPWDGGNPNDTLYYAQLKDCKKIFETEIKLLSPKVVVMLTGESWSKDFLRYLNSEHETKSICKDSWDGYECKVYQINGTTFIRTEHPQGKKENIHIQCLINLIKKFIQKKDNERLTYYTDCNSNFISIKRASYESKIS